MGWNMIRTLSLLLALMMIIAQHLWATAYTSTQAGDFNADATWGGGDHPVDGDTAIINHAVIVGSSAVVGLSGANGTAAITINGGSLTVSAPLISKGDIVQNNGVTVYGTAGGSITFAPPSGSTYVWVTGPSYPNVPDIDLSGTADNRFILATAQGGGGNFYFDETNAGLAITLDYVTLDYVGDDANPAMSGIGMWNPNHFDVNHTLINHCGAINRVWASGESIANIKFKNSDIRNPLVTGSAAVFRLLNNTTPTTSARLVENITVYGTNGNGNLDIGTLRGATIHNIYTYNSTIGIEGQSATNIFMVNDAADTNLQPALRVANKGGLTYSDMVFLSNADNPHYIVENSASGSAAANVYTGMVFDGNGYVGSDAGDCLVLGGGSATIRNSIAINKAGTLATLLLSNSKLTAVNNTSYNSYHISVGETAGAATQAECIENNLFVSQDSGVYQETAFVSQTNFTLRNNAYYGMAATANIDFGGKNTYLGPQSQADWWSTGAYGDTDKGTGDVYANPAFVDPTRTVRGFGGWATVQAAAREMVTINGIDYTGADTTATEKTVGQILAYIRFGFTPTNPAVAGKGAIDVATLGNPAALLMVR